MLFLVNCDLYICVDSVFVCVNMAFGFMSCVGCKSEVLSCGGSLEAIFVVGLPAFDASNVWLIDCVTYFIVSSIMSPWSVSRSELDCGEIKLIDAGVLWLIGGGRKTLATFEFWVAQCTQIGPGGS